MNVFLAAGHEHRRKVLGVAKFIEEAGHTVTARWITGKADGAKPRDNASYNLTDIVVADCFVLLTKLGKRKITNGDGSREVELGYALRAAKRVILVGPRSNVYHHLRAVTQVPSVEALLEGPLARRHR